MPHKSEHPISLVEAKAARSLLASMHKPTPLRRHASLCRAIGAEVYVKHENFNPTGSFKIRGGLNLMHHLKAQGVEGVITYSTGNHGLSVATSALRFGLGAMVVVPEGANRLKMQAIRDTGAELVEFGADFEQAGEHAMQLKEEKGLYFVHPANEPHIINGVATEFLEIIEKLPELEVLLLPLGNGSEVAAALTVLKQLKPQVQVIAVQAASAPAAHDSWKAGKILTAPNTTFAGGVATGIAYEIPFGIYKDALADIILLSEDELYQGMALAAFHTRNLLEGAGGACLRAAFKIKERLAGKTVALQFSGCNAAPQEIQRAMQCACLQDGVSL
jgi:threonine dehydratase